MYTYTHISHSCDTNARSADRRSSSEPIIDGPIVSIANFVVVLGAGTQVVQSDSMDNPSPTYIINVNSKSFFVHVTTDRIFRRKFSELISELFGT